MPEVSVEPARVRLWDARAAVEISAPLPGVMRLRHAPSSHLSSALHPELPHKRSWAVVESGALPLEIARGAGRISVRAPGAAVEVAPEPLGWSFGEGEAVARCLAVRGEAKVGYPVPHYRSTLVLAAPPGEAWLGFGEKVGPVDKRGHHFTFWNTDVLPHQPDTDPLYASIPFFLAIRGGVAWGLLLDETWRSEVDVALAHPEELRWDAFGPELDVYLLAGPSPSDVLGRLGRLTGRARLPPLWSLGVHQSRWGYESAAEIRDVVRAYRAHRLPLDAVHVDIDHLEGFRPWTWDGARFPDPPGLVRWAGEQGVRVVTIVDPALKKEDGYAPYDEARARNLLVREDRGEPVVGAVWPSPCVFPDFTREETQDWWAGWHRGHLEMGVAGIWNDMNEPSAFSLERPAQDLQPPTIPRGLPSTVEGPTLPYDARHGPRRHLEVHNVYGSGMCRATAEAFRRYAPGRRPFVLTRAAYAGIQRDAALWTGDNSGHWPHLELAIAMVMGLGVSGVPFCGADVPGFLGRPSGELCARWAQAAAFHPLFRFHAARGTPPKEPWRFGEPHRSAIRAALELRYRLLPTLYTRMREASSTGLPPVRPLALHHPSDPEALRADDQFLFGEDLLVAPIVRPGQTRRLAWLPEGAWLEWFGLAEPGAVARGGEHVIARAPLPLVPIWLRQGGGVALTEPALHTTTARWEVLEWHVHPGPAFAAEVYEDDGDGDGPWRLTRLRGTREGGEVSLRFEAEGALPPVRAAERIVLHGLGRDLRGAAGARIVESAPGRSVVEASPGAEAKLVLGD